MRFDLNLFLKTFETTPEQFKQHFLELSSFPNHSKIFTKASKYGEEVVVAAAAGGNFQNPSLCRLLDNWSIYAAELHTSCP